MGKMKIKTLLILVICFVLNKTFAQQIYQATINDKVSTKPIQGATCILIQKSNRKMLGYARSDGFGRVVITTDTLKDSIIVWVLHKKYVEYNTIIDLENKSNYSETINLLPMSRVLKEVIISGKKAITMNGDTVSYIADSFKLKAGASVEDLLKKLPGIQVAKDGTIKAMGKKVEKVLIDGDDFFGEDAAAATRNLDANMIDKVEVIDASNRKSESSGSDDDKTKIINLKLKDDAKKGYFGRVEGGYADTKRYTNTNILNVFKGNTKVSGYMLADNMQSRMSWQDRQDLGIGENWVYDEDLDTYIEKNGNGGYVNTYNVIPQNIKTGGIVSQKFSDNSGAIKANYRYNQSIYDRNQSENTTTFLTNATRLNTSLNYVNSTQNRHNISFNFEKNIDTNQKIEVNAGINLGNYTGINTSDNEFKMDSLRTNYSTRQNPFDNQNQKFDIGAEYEYKFKKKGRYLILNSTYQSNVTDDQRYNLMQGWVYRSITDSSLQELNQNSISFNKSNNTKLSSRFVEPIFTKGMTLELGVSSVFSRSTSLQNTFNKNLFSNEYTELNRLLSNNYYYSVDAWSEQAKLNYKTKKIECYISAKFHQIHLNQENIDSGDVSVKRTFEYFLPSINMIWKYRRNSSMTFGVNKSIRPPQLQQLQPVVNNSNPQYIQVGNPNLQPIEQYNYSVKNQFSYPISQSYLWASASYRDIKNDIVDSIHVSEDGASRAYFTQIDGNFTANANVWAGFNFKKIGLGVNPGFYMNLNNRNSYLNAQRFNTKSIWSSFNLSVSKTLDSILEPSVSASIDWNHTYSDNPAIPTSTNLTWKMSTELDVKLPYNFSIGGEVEYNIYPSNKAFADNQTFFLMTGFLQRTFLKDNSLIARFTAYDIFGQNRSVNRNVYSNTVSESVSQVLSRYFMLTMTYKFKNKSKKGSNEPEL